jgi:hypothetical protein
MTRDAQTTSRQGGLTLKISKIRGGIKFYIQIFSRRNFQGGVNFCRFLPWSPPLIFFPTKFSRGATPYQHPLWATLVMTKYLYKTCFTDYIRCQCESIFTVRELREFCGNAFSLRESRPVPHLKFLIPLPPVPVGLPFGALL